ncbi:hypothetical protein Ancab_031123 [Ancistrocladus abbreviatus]
MAELASAIAKPVLEKGASYLIQQLELAWNHKDQLTQLKEIYRAISAVLQDGDQMQNSSNSQGNWLNLLKDVAYDIDDLMDEVATDALQKKISQSISEKVSYRTSHISLRLCSSRKFENIRKKLDQIASFKRDFQLTEHPMQVKMFHSQETYSFVNKARVFGREKAQREVLDIVLRISRGSSTGLSVLPIFGMGGIGKTTLAKLVFSDPQIDKQFKRKLWACSSEKYELKKIIEDIIGESKSTLSIEQSQKKIRNILDGQRFFLVLDNMWTDDPDQWNELKDLLESGAAEGSVVLVTTRSAKVASVVSADVPAYVLTYLSSEDCWSIFSTCVFRKGEEHSYPHLVGIGKLIVNKCGGVPLAVQTLGSLLCGERSETVWKNVPENDLWKSDRKDGGIRSALKLSYDGIPSQVKPCFQHCSTIAKGGDVVREPIIRKWMALGLLHPTNEAEELEDVAHRYFDELLSRSFFQDLVLDWQGVVWTCKMHDLIHDLAASVAGDEQAVVNNDKQLKKIERARHISWSEEELLGKEFPKEQLLEAASKVRSFTFLYKIEGQISNSFLNGLISSFGYLRILDLSFSGFKELPDSIKKLKHLKFLDLSGNHLIKALPNSICKLLNLKTLSIIGCEEFRELPRDVDKLVSLRSLALTSSKMTTLPQRGLRGLTALRCLYLVDCVELESLSEDLGHLTALSELRILNCPKLATLPDSMKLLTSLNKIELINCEVLDLMQGEGINDLKKLETLAISGLPKFEGLPDGFKSISLRRLLIQTCQGLTMLPESLKSCSDLERLVIEHCPLSGIPQWLPSSLISLRELVIDHCPKLSSQCIKDTGHDWPLISQIHLIEIDGERIQGHGNCVAEDRQTNKSVHPTIPLLKWPTVYFSLLICSMTRMASYFIIFYPFVFVICGLLCVMFLYLAF